LINLEEEMPKGLIKEENMRDKEVMLIKCTAQDVADYMRYRHERDEKSFIDKLITPIFSPFESEEDFALESFNKFIKYRYFTSKVDEDLLDLYDKNFIADISGVNILSDVSDLSKGDFNPRSGNLWGLPQRWIALY
jgi:hypothetical protein